MEFHITVKTSQKQQNKKRTTKKKGVKKKKVTNDLVRADDIWMRERVGEGLKYFCFCPCMLYFIRIWYLVQLYFICIWYLVPLHGAIFVKRSKIVLSFIKTELTL